MISKDFYGRTQAVSTSFYALGTSNAFAHNDFCWEPAVANKHISLSPSPSPCLIFSSLLPVIPLPHLSVPLLFTGDGSATPLAKRLAEICRMHQLSRTFHLLIPSSSYLLRY